MAQRRRQRSDLAGITRIIVDGSNQRGGSDDLGPEEAYVRSLAAVFPPHVELVVVVDTDPLPGAGSVRQLGRARMVHARAGGGDDEIVRRVEPAPTGVLVISDDIELTRRVRLLGSQVERNEWLRARQASGRPAASSIGQPLNPNPRLPDNEDDHRPAWHAGRRATVKRGPSRKSGKRHQGRA